MSTSFDSSGTTSSLITTLLSTTPAKIPASATTTPSNAGLSGISSLGDSSLSSHDQSNQALISNYRDPFYASTFPVCYALAATTVTAYMLLIMLFMTPRSFLDGGVVYLGRRSGFTHSSSGGENIGGRPWLQKVAALTVAVSLTIATYDTFKIAALQYSYGVQNAASMQSEVMGSMELRVTRLVSNFFLWLAQAQTLIRLFPRHREKVIIKWVAFALITLDLIFSAINSFKRGESGASGPNPAAGSFDHPIPALSYMFQLLLGVLYAAWVIYYSLMKKRYAFYHHLMRNMCVLAMISLTSILIPVVFFILDISRPKFAGWGDYVRWVGAAAASVIVWEWVERIEALEREEKKGGILGREVLDGDDDVLEVSALEYPWDRKRGQRKDGKRYKNSSNRSRSRSRNSNNNNSNSRNSSRNNNNSSSSNNDNSSSSNHNSTGSEGWAGGTAGIVQRRNHSDDASFNGSHQRGYPTYLAAQDATAEPPTQRSMAGLFLPHWPARPAATLTHVSRTDTPSVASTVYAVRYQPCSETTVPTPELFPQTFESNLPPADGLADASIADASIADASIADAPPADPPPADPPPADPPPADTSPAVSSSASLLSLHAQPQQMCQGQHQQQHHPLPCPPSPPSPQQTHRNSTTESVLHDSNSLRAIRTHTDSMLLEQHAYRTSTRHPTTSSGPPSSNSTIDVESRARSPTPTPTRTRHWQGLTQTSSMRRSSDGQQAKSTTTDVTATGAQDVNVGTNIRHEAINSRWDIKSRLEIFAATQADRVREKLRPSTDTDSLPVTYIPAPPRKGTAPRDPAEDDDELPRCSSTYDSSSDSDQARRRLQLQQDMSLSVGMEIDLDHQRHFALSGQQPSLSPMSPPLWPGVRRHKSLYEDEDEDEDGEDDDSCTDISADESSLEESRHTESEDSLRICGDTGE
ncbi:hypothetical protein E4U21_004883 [Claviceps maximensis]|nr:hypothetical protein E4U21_004883 [Claviceps maximensis]